MPRVISNTGPLLALVEIGQLELLRQLFGAIVIPPAVRTEILSEPAQDAVQAALASGWIAEQSPTDLGAVRVLRNDLDAGESEAIALAQETALDWLILDDLAARHLAEALGLPVIGTLGVLLKAKDAGHLSALKPVLDQLRQSAFYISDPLYRQVLQSAGEAA